MPRTRSKRMRRRRSRHIRHRGRKIRVSRRKNRRKRISRRVMRGGNLLGKSKQLKRIPPGGDQPGDDDFTWSLGADSKDKKEGYTNVEELAQMKAKQRNEKRKFDENIEQDKKDHYDTDKKLKNQLSDLRKMVGQTSQSSTNRMTCVKPIPNSSGTYKVLDLSLIHI